MSLNGWILHRLQLPDLSTGELWEKCRHVYGDNLLSVVQFGSSVRGEARASSDIDLLLVMSPEESIDRGLYRKWDAEIAPYCELPYSPQFSHMPHEESPSSLWLEVALEGVVVFASTPQVQGVLSRLRERIASGEFVRRMSYGHPYWVHEQRSLKRAK